MSQPTCVIMINGVLRKIVGNDPIKPGIMMFSALASVFNVVLVGNNAADWLKEQGIEYDMLVDEGSSPHDNLVDTLRFSYGYNVELVVEPDPDQAADLFDAGYTVLGYMHPSYSHPSWRPLRGPGSDAVPWGELRGVVMRDRLEKASDRRTETQEEA